MVARRANFGRLRPSLYIAGNDGLDFVALVSKSGRKSIWLGDCCDYRGPLILVPRVAYLAVDQLGCDSVE